MNLTVEKEQKKFTGRGPEGGRAVRAPGLQPIADPTNLGPR